MLEGPTIGASCRRRVRIGPVGEWKWESFGRSLARRLHRVSITARAAVAVATETSADRSRDEFVLVHLARRGRRADRPR